MSNHLKTLWLIGAGPMAVEYAKVLTALSVDFSVIGRGEDSARRFHERTGIVSTRGGLLSALEKNIPETAIIAVGVDQLAEVCLHLLAKGVQKILVEKPGGLDVSQIESVVRVAEQQKARVYVAYNRRFYSSTRRAAEMIREDGGVRSFSFDFTEWGHSIAALEKPGSIKKNWLFANSSHLIDLAFFLGGKPIAITAQKSGSLDWHPRGALYVGHGTTERGALFSYHANWQSPGSWHLDVRTASLRLFFQPLESLRVQKVGSRSFEDVVLDVDDLDRSFKPGVYLQTKNFLEESDLSILPTMTDQLEFLRNVIDPISA